VHLRHPIYPMSSNVRNPVHLRYSVHHTSWNLRHPVHFYGSFSAKEPSNWWLLWKKDLQLKESCASSTPYIPHVIERKASSPPCISYVIKRKASTASFGWFLYGLFSSQEPFWEVGGWGRDPKKWRGEIGGWGRVPFNEPYAPSLSTMYDGA